MRFLPCQSLNHPVFQSSAPPDCLRFLFGKDIGDLYPLPVGPREYSPPSKEFVFPSLVTLSATMDVVVDAFGLAQQGSLSARRPAGLGREIAYGPVSTLCRLHSETVLLSQRADVELQAGCDGCPMRPRSRASFLINVNETHVKAMCIEESELGWTICRTCSTYQQEASA